MCTYLVEYFSTVLRTSWYKIWEESDALIRLHCPLPLAVLLESGKVNSYTRTTLEWICGILYWGYNDTSQIRWHAFVHDTMNDPETKPVPQLITFRMPWNNSSTWSHCDVGEFMRPPSLSSGYMQKCLRSIMVSAKPHTAVSEEAHERFLWGEYESSVTITPQT